MRQAWQRHNLWLEALPAWQSYLIVFAVVVSGMTGLQLADGAALAGAFTGGLICGVAIALISLVARSIRARWDGRNP
jgi:multisubunit Na+/H+ antiporter MnhB subunit